MSAFYCVTCGQARFVSEFCCERPMESTGRTPAEWEVRIDDAANIIIHCWADWEAGAEQDAQQAQHPGAWKDEMLAQVKAVLEGLVFDADTLTPNRGA